MYFHVNFNVHTHVHTYLITVVHTFMYHDRQTCTITLVYSSVHVHASIIILNSACNVYTIQTSTVY